MFISMYSTNCLRPFLYYRFHVIESNESIRARALKHYRMTKSKLLSKQFFFPNYYYQNFTFIVYNIIVYSTDNY